MGLFARRCQKFAFFTIRHASRILTLATVLSIVSVFFAVQLYRNLRTDMEELLPNTARSVMDLRQVRDRLQSTQSLAVLVFSKNTDASRRFIDDLAARIPQTLGPEIGHVEYRIDREIRFFKEKRPLFIDTKDLVRIRNFVRDRIQYEKELYNPLNIFRTEEIPEPSFDFGGLQKKYTDKVSSFTRFKDGYYANADETIRVALVFLKGTASGISQAKKVVSGVQGVVNSLDPKSYSPDMQVKFAGDVMNFVEEHESLIHDLEFSSIVVMVLVTFAMLLYYRDFWMTWALVTSLLVGTLWTFAVAYFAVGYLNANSAFLGSIVIGNGINYGIIFLARYLEERRHRFGHHRATVIAVRETSMATLTASLAAGLAYGSLAFTKFRGFRQFGIIGLIGMVLCWVSAFTVMPALITAVLHYRPEERLSRRIHRLGGGFSNGIVHLVRRFPRTILSVSMLLFFLSGVALMTYRGEIIETDTSKLRDRRSMQSGSGYLSKYLDEVFGRYISPLVIMAETPDEMDRIAANIKAYRDHYGRASFVSQVYTLHDFVPNDQKRKVALLREIRSMLTPKIVSKLSPRERKWVRDLLPPGGLKPFGVGDLPPIVLDRFRLKNGKIGNLVLVEPVVNKVALANGDNQYQLISSLRKAADAVHPGAPVVGTLPVTVDMYESVRKDGPRATAIAFLSVVCLVILLFRQPSSIFLTLFSLILGVAWLLGIIFAADLKINFLNFIALPITFGIGVDYGVNIVQRYRVEGRAEILGTLRNTGSAVALASLTTIIGYGSLLLAGNQAFFSFGRLAILGEVTCLVAALLSLPSYLYYRDVKRRRRLTAIDTGEATREQLRRSA